MVRWPRCGGCLGGGVGGVGGRSGVPRARHPHASADVVVVGGGFGGAYMAWQLSVRAAGCTVVVLEKENALGGRLFSDDNDDENITNKDELGGMRLFPSVQRPVADLIEEIGLHLTPIKLTDKDNWFYSQGKRTRKAQHRINGKTPDQIVANAVKTFFHVKPELASVEPLNCPERRRLSLRQFLVKYGCTQSEVDEWFAYSGYDIFSRDDVQASVFFHEAELYDSRLDSDQRYVQEGFQTVVQRMAELSGARIELNSSVFAIKRSGKRRVVHYTDSLGTHNTISALHVVCALPQDVLGALAPSTPLSMERKTLVQDTVVVVPLFKCFLEWAHNSGEAQWWEELGFRQGKSTTDLHIRQLHYYDHEDLLLYNSGIFADYWHRKFERDPDDGARTMFEQVKQVHGVDDLKEPEWAATIFKYWPNGSHKWRCGVNIVAAVPVIANGMRDGSRVHICGDAFSTHQGWTMGCVETAEIVLSAILPDLELNSPGVDTVTATDYEPTVL